MIDGVLRGPVESVSLTSKLKRLLFASEMSLV